MSATVDRTLSGTYLLRADGVDVILTRSELANIADMAIADGIVGQTKAIDTDLAATRDFLGSGTLHAGYRATLYVETGIALAIAWLFQYWWEIDAGWKWLPFVVQPVAFLWLFNMAHRTFEAALRADEEE